MSCRYSQQFLFSQKGQLLLACTSDTCVIPGTVNVINQDVLFREQHAYKILFDRFVSVLNKGDYFR